MRVRPGAPSEAMAAGIDVFVSARSDDRDAAERVYRFLAGHGLRVFLSQLTLPALGDTDYRKAIDAVLETATHLVVVTSTGENARSRWVEHEWGSFLNEKLAGRKAGNLVTVTVGRALPHELPLALRNHQVLALDDDGLDRLLRYVGSGARPDGAAAALPVRGRSLRRRAAWVLAGTVGPMLALAVWLLAPTQRDPPSMVRPPAEQIRPDPTPWRGIWDDSSRDRQGAQVDGRLRLDVAADGSASGVYGRPRDGSLDDGSLEGRLTADGRTLEGRWVGRNGQRGLFVFRLEEDGKAFRGLYSLGNAVPDANTANLWNGSRPAVSGATLGVEGSFTLLIQCYPSHRDSAEQVAGVARGLGLRVEQPHVLREGQLAPRKSEILYFSDASRMRGLQLQGELRSRLGVDLPVNASEYYPDSGTVGKLRINLF